MKTNNLKSVFMICTNQFNPLQDSSANIAQGSLSVNILQPIRSLKSELVSSLSVNETKWRSQVTRWKKVILLMHIFGCCVWMLSNQTSFYGIPCPFLRCPWLQQYRQVVYCRLCIRIIYLNPNHTHHGHILVYNL